MKTMRINSKKRRSQNRVKINSRTKIKNLISLSSKMTTKILKGWEKFVNTIKKLKNIRRERVILKSKEIKSTIKLKPLQCLSPMPKKNSKPIKRKSCSRSIKFMSLYRSDFLKLNTLLKLVTSYDYKKIFQILSYLPSIHSVDLTKE